jgi:hypothetical protein
VTEPGAHVDVLLRTSDKAFGATDIARISVAGQEPTRGPGDLSGPLDLALALVVGAHADDAVADKPANKPGSRLVVTGDSDMLQPALLEAPELANRQLASAWTGWLTQREALIEIPPKKVKSGSINFTQDGLAGLLFRVVVLLPAAALLLGLAVWFQRRA